MDSKTLSQIRAKLGHAQLEWTPNAWLDTGIPDLNRVLGHADKGLAYGRIIEMSGWESSGKSALGLSVAALAQRNGAVVVWGDIENSWDPGWAKLRGFLKCPKCSGTGVQQSAKGAAPRSEERRVGKECR